MLEIEAPADLGLAAAGDASDLSKVRVADACRDAAELMAVKEIEELGAQLEPDFFGEGERFGEGQVFADIAEAADLGVAVGTGAEGEGDESRVTKGGAVEVAVAGGEGAREFEVVAMETVGLQGSSGDVEAVDGAVPTSA